MPMRNGVRSETSHADYESLSHQTVLRRITGNAFRGGLPRLTATNAVKRGALKTQNSPERGKWSSGRCGHCVGLKIRRSWIVTNLLHKRSDAE